MKIVLSLCMFLSLTLYGASIENVQVDTSGAPSNYVITYDFVPSPGKVAAKAHIDMVLSDNNGETYMFPLQYYYGGQYGNYGIDGDLSGKILEGYESHKINSGLNKKVFFNPMIYIAGSDGCYDSPFVNVSSPQARIRVIASDSEEYTTIPTGLFWYSTFIKNKSRMYLFIKENVLYAVSTNRVYWTIDGKTWQSDMNNNVFGNICTHFSYGNKMWLIDYISGNPIKRIWSSSNGVDWNIVNNNPNYELHGDFIKAQVFKGSVWIPNKDIWYSKDCINWYIATTNKYLYAYGNINNITAVQNSRI